MSLLIHTAVIKRKTLVTDGQGGRTHTYTPIKVCAGRLSPASGTDLMLAQQMQAVVSHVIYLPPDVTVKIGDLIEIDGRTVAVRVPNLRPSLAHHLKVMGIEVQSGANS